MKQIRLLMLCFIVLSLVGLFGCGDADVPEVPKNVRVEYETLTLRWDEVEGARIYTVRIEAPQKDTVTVELSRNYYSLESLGAGDYTVSVRAEGQQGKDSPFSERVSFSRDAESGLVFRLVDGKEYEVCSVGEATGVVEVPAIYRQLPVRAIGEKAFFSAGEIREVRLPEGIRSIGAFAFANCTYLEKINLPTSLLTLGESAFSGCRMLSGALVLPRGITEIPKGAFAYCSKIESVTFGDELVKIGDNAFTDLSDLTSISFPSSLRSIGAFAFAACADVTELTFCEGLLEIGEFAFSKALSLASVTLPNSLLSIGKGAFYHSSALSTVTLGTGLTKIGDCAFLETLLYNNSPTNEIYVGNWFLGLKNADALSLEIKEGTVGIADNALYANKNIVAPELPDSVKYIGESAFALSNIVSIVVGSGVEVIGDQAFLYCEKLIDVVLGSFDYTEQALKQSSLRYIGTYAFMNCKKLARIDIPDTVEDIGAYAFRNTEIYNGALTGAVYADNWIVDFNETVTDDVTVDRGTLGIARYAFYGCEVLRSIRIDSSVKYIGRGAFYNCTALEEVTFPDSLSRIEDYTFYNCSSLKLRRLPPMLKEIGRSAFYMCGTTNSYADDTDSDTLEIPAGVRVIGDYAFFGCGYRRADAINGQTETAGIDIITMGDKLESIGKCAFRGFSSLRRVEILGVSSIADRAFYECTSLEQITVGGGLLSLGERAFYRCGALQSVSLPDTLLSVGDSAFYMCEALQQVHLGNGLERIGEFAFYGDVLLESLTLPTSLEEIASSALYGCRSLRSLVLGPSLRHVGAHAFYGCDALTLYVDKNADRAGWDEAYNSTFAGTVFGCEISPEGYVLSVVGSEDTVTNVFSDTVLQAPQRGGYTFLGWSADASTSEAELSLEDVINIKSTMKLYAVYRAQQPAVGADENAN